VQLPSFFFLPKCLGRHALPRLWTSLTAAPAHTAV
jgi:hypothetical protein